MRAGCVGSVVGLLSVLAVAGLNAQGISDPMRGPVCCAGAAGCGVAASIEECVGSEGAPLPAGVCCAVASLADPGCLGDSCYSGASGTEGVGACRSGSWGCPAGGGIECSGEVTPAAETCDGVDNDCDGEVDEAGTCCGNGVIDAGERCDGLAGVPSGGEVACHPAGHPNACNIDFSGVGQLYCNGSCSWAGGIGCDQADADLYCRLRAGSPTSTATSFHVGPALSQPGFPCCVFGFGDVDFGPFPEYGVDPPVCYQTTSILANHGPGEVIDNAACSP